MQQPLVSIITPTYGRQAFLPAIAACVRAQSYQNIEWLVLDDSETPSAELTQESSSKVRYFHTAERLSVGEKRNDLLERSNGEVIVHFDDDDFYGANYISNALEYLSSETLDVTLLKGFFVAHLNSNDFGYYRTLRKKGPAFAFNRNGVNPVNLGEINIPFIHLCYGWSYVYKKRVWDQIKFKALNTFEDREFIRAALKNFKSGAYESREMDCVHSVHNQSSSQCFPQFLIPDFIVRSLSPEAYRHILRLRRIGGGQSTFG